MSNWVLQTGGVYPSLEGMTLPEPFSLSNFAAPYPKRLWTVDTDSYPVLSDFSALPKPFSLSAMQPPTPTWMWKVYEGYDYPYLPMNAPDTSFPSASYKKAIVQSYRQSKISGNIVLEDGTEISFDDNNISAGSLSLSSTMVNGDYYISGAVPSAEMSVTLFIDVEEVQLYRAKISLSFWLMLESGDWYEVPLGKFNVASIDNDSRSGLAITAYDDMERLGGVPFTDLGFVGETLYTSSDIVYACANAIGVEVEQSPSEILALSPLRGYRLGYVDGSVETARDLLMHLSQIMGCFIYENRWGKMEVVPLGIKEPYITVSDNIRSSSSFSKFVYQIKNTAYTTTKYDEDNRKYLKGTTSAIRDVGVTVPLDDNPLWSLIRYEDQPWEYLFLTGVNWIQDILTDAAYNPATVDWYGDPAITLGDWITYTGGRLGDKTVTAPITSYTWTYRNMQTLESCGKEALADVVKSQTDKELDALTENQITYVDEVMEQVKLRQMSNYMGIKQFTYGEVSKYTYEQILKGEK